MNRANNDIRLFRQRRRGEQIDNHFGHDGWLRRPISPHATYNDGSSVGGPYYIEANDEWYPIIAPIGYQTNEGYNNPLVYFYYPSVTGKYAVTISLPATQGGGSWAV